jgi:hypothetical protein
LVDEPPLQTTLDTSTEKVIGAPVRRAPARRGRRSGSSRHRKVAAGGRKLMQVKNFDQETYRSFSFSSKIVCRN